MIETRVQGVSKMSGKRNKSGQKSSGHVVASAENLAEKERADRIAAAEAMSCLSSVILLSSDLDKDTNATSTSKEAPKNQKRTRNSQKSPQGNKIGTESKRGKSRSGRGRGTRSANHHRGESSVRTTGNPQSVNSMVEGVIDAVHEVSRVGVDSARVDFGVKRSLHGKVIERVMPVPQEKQVTSRVAAVPPRSRPPITPSHSSNQVTNIPSELQIAILSKLNASGRDHRQAPGEQLVLKLPLVINNDNTVVTSVLSTSATVSPASVTSTDSVEFTQSTVDKLLQPPNNSNKFDSLDSALPLKKRKLLSYINSATKGNEESDSMETNLTTKQEQGGDVIDLTRVKVEPEVNQHQLVPNPSATTIPVVPITVTPVTSATLNPVSVDPRTSLMLLTEMQMALQQDEDGDLPLHIAVAQENIVMVQKFVHLMSISGKSVDKYNKAQQTPLHLAVELDFVDAVKTLLLAKANPNLVNKRGENAVHLAVKVQTSDCLKYMIHHSHNKIDLNTRNFEGLAPLHTAVERNDLPIVDMLLRAGADINILDGKSGKTPLFYSVEHNYLPMVEFLQSRGANVDLTNYAGITVVMAAQARGYQEAATLLLKGMDSQAYHELKDNTPTKKIPIPRIPSKSHLIVNSDSVNSTLPKNFKLPEQNACSSSNEAMFGVKSYQGSTSQHFHGDPGHSNIKKEVDTVISGYQLLRSVVPTNLQNGFGQPSQSRPENTMSEIARKVSYVSVSPSVSSQGSDTKGSAQQQDTRGSTPSQQQDTRGSTPSQQQDTRGSTPSQQQDTKPTLRDIHSSQSPQISTQPSHYPLSKGTHPQGQAQPPTSQAQPPTNHVPSSSRTQAQSSVLTLPLHPNYKSSTDQSQDNPHPKDSTPPPTDRQSPHPKDDSTHTRDSSTDPKESTAAPLNISLRESAQYISSSPNPVNSPPNLVTSSSSLPNTSSKTVNSLFYHSSNFPLKDNSLPIGGSSPHRGSASPHRRSASPHRANQQKRLVKLSSNGKIHVEKAVSGSKGQGSGSSKGSMPSSQMYHLTNISKSTASILAAKLQGIYTSKANQGSRPLNLSTSIPDSVNAKVKEET